ENSDTVSIPAGYAVMEDQQFKTVTAIHLPNGKSFTFDYDRGCGWNGQSVTFDDSRRWGWKTAKSTLVFPLQTYIGPDGLLPLVTPDVPISPPLQKSDGTITKITHPSGLVTVFSADRLTDPSRDLSAFLDQSGVSYNAFSKYLRHGYITEVR